MASEVAQQYSVVDPMRHMERRGSRRRGDCRGFGWVDIDSLVALQLGIWPGTDLLYGSI